jgi:phosphoribosylaminoimidazolecarboxamide formyltransferase/IMP cyclohydrolase
MSRAVKRAILSVSDKSGIKELAAFLSERGVEILSTGGTAAHLAEAGIPVVKVSDFTGAPEVLGGRVKTLHPKIFSGILADWTNPSHEKDCTDHDLPPIDLVVVNLYPFEATIAREGVTIPEAIEQIDVGGPSMLRAAAKNHKHVLPLCAPSLYSDFMKELQSGSISGDFRMRCAIATFERTAQYDRTIAAFLSGGDRPTSDVLAERIDLHLHRVQSLRYGENPKQSAALYSITGSTPFQQLHGKELSFNNLIDIEAAWSIASSFQAPAISVIKHTNPCGVGTAADLHEALRLAIEADNVSAFGGIIGANRPFDAKCADIIGSMFLEVIVAPSFTDDAREILTKKKNLRLIETEGLSQTLDIRTAAGGLLVQSRDSIADASTWKTVTSAEPDAATMRALEFAWIVCAHVKSNAIVLTKEAQTVGIGAGQMSRVDAAKLAVTKAMQPTEGCVAASDAFFPFRDGLDLLADAGVTAVVQPGGSVRDEEVIAAANERGLAMVFTGERHFRH